VIVALAAWLYIIQALLGLGSLFTAPAGFGGGMSSVATFVVSGIFGAMGYGLLKRERWARWLALGVSLLSWTLGTLCLLGVIATLALSGHGGAFIAMMFSGELVVFAVILVIVLLVMLVSVVVSFKLFFHLCSDDGCDEFDVPYGSAHTVAASAGTWLAIMVTQGLLAGGGAMSLLAPPPLARNESDATPDPIEMQADAAQQDHARQREEEIRHAEQDARLRAMQAEAQRESPTTDLAADGPVVAGEAPVPVLEKLPEAEEKADPKKVLKCRDAAGAVMFTQGYCPPGTRRVEMHGTD
jgi:hypothetical protein